MNRTGNDQYISADAVPIPLPDCIKWLERYKPTPAERPHVSKLRNQIRSWHRAGNRDGLRKEIARTIAEIESAA